MTRLLLLVAGLFLIANFATLMLYRGVIRGSYLFVTTGTILYPLASLDLAVGLLALASFVWLTWFKRTKQ